MNDYEEKGNGDGDGGYGVPYMTVEGCGKIRGELIQSIRENRQVLHGTPGSDSGLIHKVTVLFSEWNTFKGLVKFLMGSSLLLLVLNLLTLFRMFNII